MLSVLFDRIKGCMLIILLAVTCETQAASHHPQAWLKTISGSPDEGERIVDHYCANCHAMHPRIPLGAPRIQQTKDWQHRLAQGMAILFKHTDEGYNAMPARGGCFECTDHQLYLAILAMLPRSNPLPRHPERSEGSLDPVSLMTSKDPSSQAPRDDEEAATSHPSKEQNIIKK